MISKESSMVMKGNGNLVADTLDSINLVQTLLSRTSQKTRLKLKKIMRKKLFKIHINNE